MVAAYLDQGSLGSEFQERGVNGIYDAYNSLVRLSGPLAYSLELLGGSGYLSPTP